MGVPVSKSSPEAIKAAARGLHYLIVNKQELIETKYYAIIKSYPISIP